MSDQSIKFNANEIIFAPGKNSECFYIINEGQVGIFRVKGSSEKIPIAILSKKEFLGEMSFMMEKPHSSLAIALTEVTALKLTRAHVKEVMKSTPQWLTKMLILTMSRLNNANDLIKRNNVIDETLSERVKCLMDKVKKSEVSSDVSSEKTTEEVSQIETSESESQTKKSA